MRTPDFTQRRLELFTVKELGTGSVRTTSSTGFGVPEYVIPMLEVGKEYYLELYRFNDIAGIMTMDLEYLFHRADEYFKIALERYLEASNKRRLDEWEKNKGNWADRTSRLPKRYRDRIERFRKESGLEFEQQSMGWGYELIVCELAALYEAGFRDENTVIQEYARKHGTSGNQHDVAKAWAKNPEAAI